MIEAGADGTASMLGVCPAGRRGWDQYLWRGFAILPAKLASRMASLIIGPLDRTGFV
jgi:hypothetical protein